jgi:hypothetical protein
MLAKISICGTLGGQHYTSNHLRFRMKSDRNLLWAPGRQCVTFTATVAAVAPGERHAHRHGHVQERNLSAGHRHAERGKSDVLHVSLNPNPEPPTGVRFSPLRPPCRWVSERCFCRSGKTEASVGRTMGSWRPAALIDPGSVTRSRPASADGTAKLTCNAQLGQVDAQCR